MPLPKHVDERVRTRLHKLIETGEEIVGNIRWDPYDEGSPAPNNVDYYHFINSSRNIFYVILGESRSQTLLGNIDSPDDDFLARSTFDKVLGLLKSLRDDYESGLLDDLSWVIEANVNHDFMEQVNQLLGVERHDFDHVPAAVLAGAVLEDAVRRICHRQDPPIETEQQNGNYRKLDWMIAQLQKQNVFSKPKAAQLRSWTAIRNSAAHGKFDEFDRAQVEEMIRGIKSFQADYL